MSACSWAVVRNPGELSEKRVSCHRTEEAARKKASAIAKKIRNLNPNAQTYLMIGVRQSKTLSGARRRRRR